MKVNAILVLAILVMIGFVTLSSAHPTTHPYIYSVDWPNSGTYYLGETIKITAHIVNPTQKTFNGSLEVELSGPTAFADFEGKNFAIPPSNIPTNRDPLKSGLTKNIDAYILLNASWWIPGNYRVDTYLQPFLDETGGYGMEGLWFEKNSAFTISAGSRPLAPPPNSGVPTTTVMPTPTTPTNNTVQLLTMIPTPKTPLAPPSPLAQAATQAAS